jgi:uncharacterized protein
LIHLFEINGDRLAFDPQSGALHLVDETAYRVLEAYNQQDGIRPDPTTLDGLTAAYGDEVHACADEVDALIQNRLLFIPPEPMPPLSALYPDGPRIKSMCLHVAHDCNLRCRYCFAGTGDFGTGSRVRMDLETGKKAVEFLIAASGDRTNLDIDFFGGEPLLNWPVVVALTEYCELRAGETGKHIRLTITTNATLLDDDKTRFINAHMKNCVLSMDGCPDTHDRMRPDAGGKGSYETVSERIRSFIRERGDREHYVRGTFTRHNLDFGRDVMHIASLGAKYLSMEPVVAPDGCGYELRVEDLPQIRAEYDKLAADYLEARASGRWFSLFHFMIDLDGGPCSYKRLKGCGAGCEYVAVTPEGDIYPCHQFVGETDFIMGNVNEMPVRLDEAVQARFSRLLVPQKPACATCWARNYCSGGCAANAWHASGNIEGTYEVGCELQKKRVECALWIKARETREAVETAATE